MARVAWRRGCSHRIKEAGRTFHVANFFRPLERIPRVYVQATAVAPIHCAIRLLTSNPSPEVLSLATRVHADLGTPWKPTRWQDDQSSCSDCDPPTEPSNALLVGLQIRTLWADLQSQFHRLSCSADDGSARVRRRRRDRAVDNVLALVVPPNFAALRPRHGGDADQRSWCLGRHLNADLNAASTSSSRANGTDPKPCGHVPSMRSILSAVALHLQLDFGHRRRWALFVASDSPAMRASAIAHARDLGIRATATNGSLGHNNLHAYGPGTLVGAQHSAAYNASRKENHREGASYSLTAAADLLVLSHADMRIGMGTGSTFLRAATSMSPCARTRPTEPAWGLDYMFLNKLVRLLQLDKLDTLEQPAPPQGHGQGLPSAGGREVDCMTDCLGLGPWMGVGMQKNRSLSKHALMSVALMADSRAMLATSAKCRRACACMLKLGLGGMQ